MDLKIVNTKYNIKMYIENPPVSTIEKHIEANGVWEPDMAEIIFKYVKPGMKVLDIGSHVGFHALNIAKVIGQTGHVWCFEANPKLASMTEKSFRLNNFNKISTIFNKGVHKENGILKFYVFDKAHGGSTFRLDDIKSNYAKSKYAQKEDKILDIPVISLDQVFLNTHIDFVRMDVEGAELAVFEGGKQFLKKHSPILFFEWHDYLLTKEESESLYKLLMEYNYEVLKLVGANNLQKIDNLEQVFSLPGRDVLCLK